MTPDERRRLREGPAPGEQSYPCMDIDVWAWCADASAVAERVREVFLALPEVPEGASEDPERWRPLLPEWYRRALLPEATREEAEAKLAAMMRQPVRRRAAAAASRPWTLSGWLFQLEPDQRGWWWWDAVVVNPYTLRVVVLIEGWPSAYGSLEWVLRAAGASTVVVDA